LRETAFDYAYFLMQMGIENWMRGAGDAAFDEEEDVTFGGTLGRKPAATEEHAHAYFSGEAMGCEVRQSAEAADAGVPGRTECPTHKAGEREGWRCRGNACRWQRSPRRRSQLWVEYY